MYTKTPTNIATAEMLLPAPAIRAAPPFVGVGLVAAAFVGVAVVPAPAAVAVAVAVADAPVAVAAEPPPPVPAMDWQRSPKCTPVAATTSVIRTKSRKGAKMGLAMVGVGCGLGYKLKPGLGGGHTETRDVA
jgi:hypothetical protein